MDGLDGRFKNVFIFNVYNPTLTAYTSLLVPKATLTLVYLYKALTDNEEKYVIFLKVKLA